MSSWKNYKRYKNFLKMKFSIFTLGCKINQIDSRELANFLIKEGLSFWHGNIEKEKGPDLVVINSCVVTQKALIKSQRKVRTLKKKYPQAFFVLAGCFPAVYYSEAKKLSVNFIWKGAVGEKAGKEIIKRFFSFYKINQLSGKKKDEKNKDEKEGEMLVSFSDRSRYFLKIQDGCNQFCSYCIIPYARKNLKSRTEKEIIQEAWMAGQNGFKEIVVSGIHLGLFGKDKNKVGKFLSSKKKDKKDSLAELLRKLCQIEKIERIRLSSIEINDINDDLLEVIAKERKICRHFHIPLQSGSDRILKKMNRPYDSRFFLKRIKKIKEILPEAVFSTDVMVGFPGESNLDFKKSCNLIKKVGFIRLHIFPFSSHKLTPAGKMKNEISQEEIKRRAKILRNVGLILAKNFKKSCQGKKEKIIVEKIEKGEVVGKAENYLEFRIHLGKKKISQLRIKKGQLIEVVV